ncbi:Inner membrane protein YjdF [compost metagenome]
MIVADARRRHLFTLAALFAVLWLALAINPHDRADWALENVLVLAFGGALFFTRRWFVFSRVSYTLIFLYLCLHAVGAHYTYSLVPYDEWWRALTGHGFNSLVGWERNNFDRVVHFSYGLLLAYPIREIFLRVVEVRGFWAYFLPLDVTLSTSALYELIEWGAAEFVGGDLGAAYLGTQGDIWDAQKDMALAALGAAIAMAVTALVNWRAQRDLARDWADSLKPGQAQRGQ